MNSVLTFAKATTKTNIFFQIYSNAHIRKYSHVYIILQSLVYIYTDMSLYTWKIIFKYHNSNLKKIETKLPDFGICLVLLLASFVFVAIYYWP